MRASFCPCRLVSRFALFLAVVGMWAGPVAMAAERSRTPIDNIWSFVESDVQGAESPDFDDSRWRHVTLPHTFNGSDGDDGGGYYRGPAWYRTHVTMPARSGGRRYFLEFDGAALATDLWINGRRIGRHEGGFARFRFDVTDALRDGRNCIAIRVDNSR